MPNAIRHMLTSLRTSVQELGETLLGPELDAQRLQSARADLRDARQHLETLLTQQLRLGREQEQGAQDTARLEDLATKALAQGREDLAEALADRILAQQADAQARLQQLELLGTQAQQLRTQIQAAEARLREFERELQMAETRAAVARTTRTVADQLADGAALRRLRERRQAEADRSAAAAQMADQMAGEDALERQLVEAGLMPDPATEPRRRLLERLRARSQDLR